MKIGTITFHFPCNCGAMLQCLALQTALKREGHDTYVINYRPTYHQNRYIPLINPFVVAKTRFQGHPAGTSFLYKSASAAKGFVQILRSWKNYSNRKFQYDKFKRFENKAFRLTPVCKNLKQLERHTRDFGMFISGSDQLWNAHITNKKFDEAYFLKFGPKEAGRITYAMGANFTEHPDPMGVLPGLISDLDAIALRELKCKDDLHTCNPNIPIFHTVDPTLLLDAADYDPFMPEEPLETEPYIFIYTMPDESRHKIYNACKLLSEKTGLKVIDGSGTANKMVGIRDCRICSPDDFLWYIKHARYVLTNSFHGTAFSVIMEKQFFVVPHSTTGNRVTELLDQVGLSKRYAPSGVLAAQRIDNPIEYDETRKLIRKLRASSLQYLRDSIEKYGDHSKA